ncbi:glycosyltransferase family 2 protein [Ahniella affigens]|uniref:glycosyltransferase family 2 protein n=1 Tax=Ahniella affigens TaxID=2021234 RepID=UPI001F0C3123|nr:glycosyltransferase family 2 protein [Ahniella affigens]
MRRAAGAASVSAIRLIDNHSNDGVPERVAALFADDSRFSMQKRADNPGFGTACNQGAASCDSDWLLFLNPDCDVDPETVDQLLARAQAAVNPGVIGLASRTPSGQLERATTRLLPSCSRLLFGPRQAQLDVAKPWQEVEAGSGALMLISRRLFEQLGGFDRDFFLHAEDLDLMARARKFGAQNYVALDLRATHHQGSSSQQRPWFVAWHKHVNLARFLWRHPQHVGDRLLWPALALGLMVHGVWEAARIAIRRQ